MKRIADALQSKIMSARDAALLIKEGMCLGCSGFTRVGHPKVLPAEIARLGTAKNLSVLTGAGVGPELDECLAQAGLLAYRSPYQGSAYVRKQINQGVIGYCDQHLGQMPALLDRGVGPHIDFAVIECAAVTEQGILLGTAVGASDSFVRAADKVILEVNSALPLELLGMHDIHTPGHKALEVYDVTDRIGGEFLPCPFEKIAAIVETNEFSEHITFSKPDDISEAISENIVRFLKSEVEAGRQPANLNPIQSGVGNVANAVLAGLSNNFDGLRMYTEVMQDSAYDMLRQGKFLGAATTAVSLSDEKKADFFENLDKFRGRLVMRPQSVSNHPEVIRRLQVVSMNTPIEFDIYGNVNSTNVTGTNTMNGIGGSGDFARNAGLTIFATGSTAKGGAISCAVPMVSHTDHTEHDVQVIVTEYGVADLRWKTPRQRAELIIENCTHPDYKAELRDYFRRACARGGHTPVLLEEALSWHKRYLDTGSMK